MAKNDKGKPPDPEQDSLPGSAGQDGLPGGSGEVEILKKQLAEERARADDAEAKAEKAEAKAEKAEAKQGPASTPPLVSASGAHGKMHVPGTGKRVRVMFPNQDGSDGALPIKVGFNGRMFLIPRETEIDLPEEALAVINDAVAVRYIGVTDNDGKVTTTVKRVPRYRYDKLGG